MLSPATLRQLLDRHEADRAAATVVTAMFDRPYGYGRIVRNGGDISKVVEERDASESERAIREVNAGIYAFDVAPLFDAIRGIGAHNAQGEYYLPDLVSIYRRRGLSVSTVTVENPDEIRGINSRSELAEVAAVMRQTKNAELMAAGVTLVDPATTYISNDVTVGADTVIHPNVYLEGRTAIGQGCELHAGVRIVDSTLGDRVTVRNYCVIADSTVATGAMLGPFAHLRPASHVGEGAHVGNFVELKKSTLGAGSKASHLDVPRRRHHRRQRQHRRRHHHLQLRRPDQAADSDRGRRLHRQRLGPRRAGDRRRRRVRRRGFDDRR